MPPPLTPARSRLPLDPLTAVTGGLILAAVLRQGAFYPQVAFGLAVAAIVITSTVLVKKSDKQTVFATLALVALATCWVLRGAFQARLTATIPLMASILAFICGLVVTRRLRGDHREFAMQVLLVIGSITAGVGVIGCVFRIYPLAMRAQNLWRLASTLTYSNAAGLLLAVCFVASLALNQKQPIVRVQIALCFMGLIASQSRAALLATAIGLLLVPAAQLWSSIPVLVSGAIGGVGIVATSGSDRPQPLVGLLILLSLGAVALPQFKNSTLRPFVHRVRRKHKVSMAALLCLFAVAASYSVWLVHVPLERRFDVSSTEDRNYEWRAAFDQFLSSPLVGVGPDQIIYFSSPQGDFDRYAHNEYLQILADDGVLGGLLLLVAALAISRCVKRSDIRTSCAAGALVVFAVAVGFDFSLHLAALGLVGGWVAGLAGGESSEVGARDAPLAGVSSGQFQLGVLPSPRASAT